VLLEALRGYVKIVCVGRGPQQPPYNSTVSSNSTASQAIPRGSQALRCQKWFSNATQVAVQVFQSSHQSMPLPACFATHFWLRKVTEFEEKIGQTFAWNPSIMLSQSNIFIGNLKIS